MDAPLDELYFRWLYSQVGNVRFKNPTMTFWSLTRQLYTKEFVVFVSNDENRAEDGRELRYAFLDENQFSNADADWLHRGCSVLEMLIAISRRLTFETEGEPREWFWHLIENLDLKRYNDSYFNPGDRQDSAFIDDCLETMIRRTYHYNGRGGLFPLRYPDHNQAQAELWHQMNAYLFERET